MTRGFGFLTALLLTSTPAIGLAQGAGGIDFGFKGGIAFGNISNKGVLPGNLEGRKGFSVGLVLNTAPGILGLGLEGLYTQSGVKTPQGTLTNGRELDYIDVPLYLRVMIPTPAIKPFAFAGPQISFEIRCEAGETSCPDLEPSGEERKQTVYAGVIGAGIRFGGSGGLSLEGRYVYGLTDLKLNTITTEESYKHRTFLILAGILF
ncbi:MAG: outer membrane beta-barrel protein [Gemmatimonadales bacterium]